MLAKAIREKDRGESSFSRHDRETTVGDSEGVENKTSLDFT
jgi:hypothetical protein